MAGFRFVSRLPGGFREELESMLYFNPQQKKVLREVIQVIDGYGPPEVVEDDGLLRVDVRLLPGSQCLFAMDGPEGDQLAGLIVFYRRDEEVVLVPHLAVKEQYSTAGPHAGERLVSQMLGKVVEIARQLRGVRSVELAYRQGLTVPVSAAR